MNDNQLPQPLLISRVVWAGLTFSLFIYGFVLLTSGKELTFDVPSSYSALETLALISGTLLFVTFNIHEKKVKLEHSLDRRFPYYVICWALHELIVVLAFAGVLTSGKGHFLIYAVNLLLALTGNFITWPKQR